MTATVLTAETLIRRYADDIAYVAQQAPATDLAALISQLDTAAPRYEAAGITGHEDLETASRPTASNMAVATPSRPTRSTRSSTPLACAAPWPGSSSAGHGAWSPPPSNTDTSASR